MAYLMNYDTNAHIRTATIEEEAEARYALKNYGGKGEILVEIDGEPTVCYVVNEIPVKPARRVRPLAGAALAEARANW